ncbi:MAG: hypothetical protein ACQGVK_17005 [Myxococcota bacterium]
MSVGAAERRRGIGRRTHTGLPGGERSRPKGSLGPVGNVSALGRAPAPPAFERELELVGERSDDGATARGVLLGSLLGGLLWTGVVVAAWSIQASYFN